MYTADTHRLLSLSPPIDVLPCVKDGRSEAHSVDGRIIVPPIHQHTRAKSALGWRST
jgi:hypothetical protein